MDQIESDIKSLISSFIGELEEKEILDNVSKKDIKNFFIKNLNLKLNDDKCFEKIYQVKEKYSGKGNAWIIIDNSFDKLLAR